MLPSTGEMILHTYELSTQRLITSTAITVSINNDGNYSMIQQVGREDNAVSGLHFVFNLISILFLRKVN